MLIIAITLAISMSWHENSPTQRTGNLYRSNRELNLRNRDVAIETGDSAETPLGGRGPGCGVGAAVLGRVGLGCRDTT